jgi:hypothetical protein
MSWPILIFTDSESTEDNNKKRTGKKIRLRIWSELRGNFPPKYWGASCALKMVLENLSKGRYTPTILNMKRAGVAETLIDDPYPEDGGNNLLYNVTPPLF